MSIELNNNTAIITGGAKGLGFEIAKEFIRLGANIMICGRDKDFLLKASNDLNKISNQENKADFIVCDVSDEDQVKNLVQTTINQFGSYEILVNNAGVYGPIGLLEDNDWSLWKKSIEINLFGSVLMYKESINHFKKNNYGKIIQLSGGGATNPLPNLSSYAVAKAGIVRFIETVSIELKDTNIFANCIAPGPLNTGMLEEILDAGPEKVGKDFYAKSVHQKEKGGASLEYGAKLASFLASSKSDGITGKLISALWDKYLEWPEHLKDLSESDIYTLRRITGRDRGYDWGDK
jgi:NAD(P)-dependent dehydrogenase (short-subunit alcohol dehydrogenase family)